MEKQTGTNSLELKCVLRVRLVGDWSLSWGYDADEGGKVFVGCRCKDFRSVRKRAHAAIVRTQSRCKICQPWRFDEIKKSILDERRTERPAEAITPETQAPTKETINCSLQFFNREIKEGEMLSGPIILNDLLHLTKVSGRLVPINMSPI